MKGVHTVKGMSFHAFHGISEVDRELGQVYSVDAAVEFGLNPTVISQEEDPIIRDSDVYEIVRGGMMDTKFKSILSLAGKIACDLLDKYGTALSAAVSVNRRQLFIPGNVESSGTEVKYTRSDFEAVKDKAVSS